MQIQNCMAQHRHQDQGTANQGGVNKGTARPWLIPKLELADAEQQVRESFPETVEASLPDR